MLNTLLTTSKLIPGTKVQVGQYVVQVDKFISEGGFAHVYLASLVSPAQVDGFPPSQNRFVLKRMAVPDKAGLVEVRREVDVMKQLRPHKHIVYFIEASASSIPESQAYEIFILMEWCPGGGIIDLLNSRLQNRLTESEILKIFSDTVAAVAHMHSQTPILIHRDLKVENILVSSPNLYKLCDFGSTTTPLPHPPQSSAEILALEADLNKHTTLQYRAPEMVDIWSRKGVTEKADIWALGVFLYKLCYYTTPFEAHGPMAIMNVQYQIPSYPAYSNSIKYLIGTMLQELAQSRPDIWEVHEHLCRLRGVTPSLRRPHRKQPPSNPAPAVSDPAASKSPSTHPSSKGNDLTSIVTIGAAPSAGALQNHKPEGIVPMRRGRPVVGNKSKPGAGSGSEGRPAAPTDNAFFQAAPPAPAPALKDMPPKKHSPPEESDLFAREAAAGFGDAFLSPSPQMPSFTKPEPSPANTATTSFPISLARSRSHLMPAKPNAAPNPTTTHHHDSKATTTTTTTTTSSSSAFDDLVPVRKKSPPKTLNQMQSGLATLPATSTGPAFSTAKVSAHDASFVTGKPRMLLQQQEPSSTTTTLSIGKTNLSQKTGPQVFPSRMDDPSNYRKISITQKTGPAHTSTPLSMSDWLKKDQPILSPHRRPAPSSAPQHETKPSSSSAAAAVSEGLLARVEKAEISSRPMPAKIANPSAASVAQEVYSSGSSDEEPEEAEGRKGYQRGPRQGQDPAGLKTGFKPASFPAGPPDGAKGGPPDLPGKSSSVGKPQSVRPHALPDDHRIFANSSPTTSSTTGLSSSEAMTEEDEEVKLRRRAAIAKFAPAATTKPAPATNKLEELEAPRDPFASRGPSQQPSITTGDVKPARTTVVEGAREKPVRRQPGPPLRAPKPHSLKSAAAITSLVSRYEHLAAGSEPRAEPSVPVGARRTSIFKPVPAASSSVSSLPTDRARPGPPSATATAAAAPTHILPRHIPVKSLGPGLPALLPHSDSDSDDPKFTSVTDLKSRWESGKLAAPLAKPPPRSDYGQT
ncbi:hypothetical protein PCANC_11623 [Puccinia coronata f. sp. avenae]|uniref:non-specific serine/threonine protein kinase n=1 Tax=Puccinia coronata f. sp. avenae TaxID=200324 RepID=A0A2N5SVI8_9BASI|nr:hypothetical protein PCANC_11623 [Puccinia coronata f. sp. avenae]